VLIRAATGDDLEAVRQLLIASDLPVDGVEENFADFIVAQEGDAISGAIGLECYGATGLLRSAVVSPDARGTGLGSQLVNSILDRASTRGIRDVYLLTTTAEEYFPKFGFKRAARAEVPASLKASREFQGACPDTAILMKHALAERSQH
jgi:amino-acid N-acetyltransferase